MLSSWRKKLQTIGGRWMAISRAVVTCALAGFSFGAVGVSGTFQIQQFRDGKLIDAWAMPNGVTNGGINNLLDVAFRNQTQIATWYLGLITSAGFTALAAGDTMASHAGWAESEDYSEGTRPAWTPGAAASQSITNGTPVDFNINDDLTIQGVFLTSNSTKGGTTGTLWATAEFASARAVLSGDLLRVTYTINGAAV